MIKKPFLAFLFAGLFGIGNAMAQTPDSLFQIEQVTDLEEIVVTASPKEYRKLREQPASTTILDEQMLQRHGIDNIKQLNGYIPNLFTPDYGSRMTSAAYIRGIGSRINTPAVGLYVDNLPFIEKSAYDFEYDAIESIDVLRGPQSTLYGRNAMGGLIRIHTKNPFRYQGTDFIIGAASYGGYRASLNTYQRVSSRLAFSAGGFLAHEDGIWRNSYTNGLMDKTDRSGLRFRMLWLPADNLKIGLNSSYEYSDQGGYPYFYRGNLEEETRSSEVGRISVNDPSHYRRHLLNNGITVEYQTNHFTLSAVTGHQYLTDNMLLDQDFTEQDLFTLGQRQQINTLSEEIALKSKSGRRWQWTTGVFGFYQWLNTNAPVAFKKEGLTTLIEDNVNDIFPSSPMAPTMHLTLNNNELAIGDIFRTPTYNLAAYHQSTFNHLFGLQGLSLTLGIRLDYEKMYIDYDSYSQPLDFTFDFAMAGVGPRPPINLTDRMESSARITGKSDQSYTQILPKIALQYEWQAGNNIYATVSRGYRSGGYNVQMFSDFVQYALRNDMKRALMESTVYAPYASMIGAMMPEYEVNPEEQSVYKPEYSWNYEAGAHLTTSDGRLKADLSVFYLDIRDQQISQFVASGAGRVTINAGKSCSYGLEASMQARLTPTLILNAAYGLTNAKFTDYKTGDSILVGEQLTAVNYKGNYIPFAPKHTLNIGAEYTIPIRVSWLNKIRLSANYNAAGRIYWTEENTVSQPFYGTLNARVAFEQGRSRLSLWANNLLNEHYNTFYFETMNNGFAQKGRPLMMGIDWSVSF